MKNQDRHTSEPTTIKAVTGETSETISPRTPVSVIGLGSMGHALAANSPFLNEDTGVPTLYDLAMLALLWSTSAGWLHSFALIGTAGVEAAVFQPYADSWYKNVVATDRSDKLAAQINTGEYPNTAGSSLGLNAAGLACLSAPAVTPALTPECSRPSRLWRIADG
ncbi:hypothetical protein [Paenibacillus sp. FSL W8-0194]|uniref:imine reductase family protein n=1 Tax=Paenibacillus sp. FSL W8-0194 TaxID=2921711 RepID=UPI0030DDB43B